LKNTIADNKRFTKLLIAKLPNWRYFFEILAKLGLSPNSDDLTTEDTESTEDEVLWQVEFEN
jgi:hypothetical protein